MLFFGQLATGLLLCVYYQPEPTHAWESVKQITEQVPYGWWIRSLHKWGANLMVIAVSLHLMRVFFTGAYRKPREINWVIGASLFTLTLAVGFTGYSLVYEQLSYWGATVGANITEAVPFIGPGLSRALRGGEEVGAATTGATALSSPTRGARRRARPATPPTAVRKPGATRRMEPSSLPAPSARHRGDRAASLATWRERPAASRG